MFKCELFRGPENYEYPQVKKPTLKWSQPIRNTLEMQLCKSDRQDADGTQSIGIKRFNAGSEVHKGL